MHGGGAERVAALLCNHWVSQGHQVTLMPTFSGRGVCLYPLDERVRLDYLADRVGCARQSIWNKLRRLWVLRCIIHKEKPDVVVSFLSTVNVAAILAGLGSGVPVIVSERTYPPMLPLGDMLERLRRWSYPHATAVVLQTERGREWLTSVSPRARGKVIPNPVVYPLPSGEPHIPLNTVVTDERVVLLAVGRLSEEKRYNQVIDAFAEISSGYPQWDLVILGEGPERASLETQRDRLGLVSRIQLPGRVGNLADWYRRASLFVMSSRFEGFPNALVEAMAHGLPVVSMDCDTGPRDIIQQHVNGRLVPQQEGVKGLTKALEEVISSPETRQKMAAAAVQIRQRFSMLHIAAQWDQILGLK